VTGAVLATANGRSAGPAKLNPSNQAIPSTQPAPANSVRPVVPLLAGNLARKAVLVARGSATGSSPSGTVAPLRGLRQADLLVVAPFSLSTRVVAAVSRQPGVINAEPIEAAKVQVNGVYTAMLGVDPSAFRGYAARPTAASTPLWQGVADGGIAVSYTMGTLDRLSPGGRVTVTGRRQEHLPVVAFGTVGIGGVDAVVSDQVATSLGMPASNAIVIGAAPSSLNLLTARIKTVLPRGAADPRCPSASWSPATCSSTTPTPPRPATSRT
jgi:peptidoglycan DL-endopeptidase CwlO